MKGKPPAKKNVSSAVFSPGASYRNICRCTVPEVPKTSVPLHRRLLYIFSGMAAGILLILGIAGLNRHFNTSTANYVIIDGKCYTDAKLVREQAMIAFRDVSISEEEKKRSMNKVIRTTWIILLLTVASGMARAQQGLQIASVFQKYGKQKGVTMVELSNEMLETYQMTLYKSLVFKDVEEALPTILNCLDADKKKAKKVKEVVAGGQIQSGYYQLPQLKEDVNRFILFKTGKKGSATLIYIEGELDADDLVTMLFMKKN